MLLYKAARARNIYVMMDALAQSAQVNWANEDDNGRTPLIQGILSVSNHVPVITDATVCI
jgi:Arf-GAP/coiled-coil/ANK repeat/PH domain-containing protein